MNHKYTKGPWRFDPRYEEVLDTQGKRVVLTGIAIPGGYLLDKEEEIQANSRLLAAAPELLEACEALLNNASLFNHETDPIWREIRDMAVRAITKATTDIHEVV